MGIDDKHASERHPEDALDRILDSALAKYAAIEPRSGLEERILANLSSAEATTPHRVWWRWGLAFAAITVAVTFVAVIWKTSVPSPPVIVNRRPVPVQLPARSASESANRNGSSHQRSGTARIRTTATRPSNRESVEPVPKLDQFPSPQPLTEQEKILESYVDQFHEQAVLVARLADQEIQKDRMDLLKHEESAGALVLENQSSNQ